MYFKLLGKVEVIKGIAVNREVQTCQTCLLYPLSFHSNLQPESTACLLLPLAMLCLGSVFLEMQ